LPYKWRKRWEGTRQCDGTSFILALAAIAATAIAACAAPALTASLVDPAIALRCE
jgi:hypothetical protein